MSQYCVYYIFLLRENVKTTFNKLPFTFFRTFYCINHAFLYNKMDRIRANIYIDKKRYVVLFILYCIELQEITFKLYNFSTTVISHSHAMVRKEE